MSFLEVSSGEIGKQENIRYNEYITAKCKSAATQDFDSPLACVGAATMQLPFEQRLNLVTVDFMVRWSHEICFQNIVHLCKWTEKPREEQEDLVWQVFPVFYFMYNSDTGKRMADELFAAMGDKLPPEAIEVMKRNYEPKVQQCYMLMNGTIGDRGQGVLRRIDYSPGFIFVPRGFWMPQWWLFSTKNHSFPNIPCKMSLRDQNSVRERFKKLTRTTTEIEANYAQRGFFYVPQAHWHPSSNWGFNVFKKDMAEVLLRDPNYKINGLTIDEIKWGAYDEHPDNAIFIVDPGAWGSPYWSHEKRQEAYRRIMPVTADGVNFLDTWTRMVVETLKLSPECTWESCFDPKVEAGRVGPYFNDPIYGGRTPALLVPANPFNMPGVMERKSGGAGSSWKNPCDDRAFLEKIMPWAIAAIAGAAVKIFLPSGKSTWALVGTAAAVGYYVGQDMYGIDALIASTKGESDNADMAATIITTAGTGSGVYFLHEQGILSFFNVNLTDYTALAVSMSAAAVTYIGFKDIVKLSLRIGGGITAWITSPISALETFILFAGNGCIAQEFMLEFACTCKEADLTGGKSGIQDTWLGEVFGTSGKQTELRRKCLQLEMARGGWTSTGEDQNVVSKCTGVMMENPFACETAQNWAYRQVVQGYGMTHKQQIDMWNQVSHCLDAENPSFLPLNPNASTYQLDKYCQTKHGEQFRAGPNGTCKNFALPGPNNTDPVGLQDPGAYAEKSSGGGWCSIQ